MSSNEEKFDPNEMIAKRIAEKYGIQGWDSVSEIRFSFNVDRNGERFKRSWIWHPKTGEITMILKGDSLTYKQSSVDSTTAKADAAFINDKYWLLAPFQLVWDKQIKIENEERTLAPISKDTLSKLTITYPNEGGYTPGDAYDFFYDTNYIIREWNYRQGNSPKPTLTTTWEGYKNFNGILIAREHKDSLNHPKPYFTDISVLKNEQ